MSNAPEGTVGNPVAEEVVEGGILAEWGIVQHAAVDTQL